MEAPWTLRTPEPMSFDGNLSENWKRFRQKFQLFTLAAYQGKKIKDNVKIAQLLTLVGDDGLEVYNSFDFEVGEENDFESVLEKFEKYCCPKQNVVFESFTFYKIVQDEGQDFNDFLKRLRLAAKSCEFLEPDNMIRDRIVLGIRDKDVQERLLREKKLDLQKAIEFCRVVESSKGHSKVIREQAKQEPYSVNLVQGRESKRQNRSEEASKPCGYCGSDHTKGKCPAFGKICNICKGQNHFARVCRSKTTKDAHGIKQDEPDGDGSEEISLGSVTLSVGEVKRISWTEAIKIREKVFNFKLDTGAEISILPVGCLKMIGIQKIKKSNYVLSAWGNDQFKISPLGHIILECESPGGAKADVEFAVVNESRDPPILGLNACVALNLVRRVSTVVQNFQNKEDILCHYGCVFEGLGRFPSTHHIEVKEGAVPQVQQSRRIPYSLQDKLKKKLDELESLGVIKKVDKPTAWVNPLVIVEKPDGSLRVCIDPTPLNKVIMREHYMMPHPDDMLVNLAGYKYFTVLDLKDGFFQIELDKESRDLCTVSTPYGRYQFCRFPNGICSGPEICQKNNYKVFGALKGVSVVHDDIIVGGATEKEHDDNLENVLNTALKYGIKFNSKKLQFKKTEVKYLGHIVSASGVRPNPDYVSAILNMEEPNDKKGVMRLLGMLKYLSKFIPNLTRLTSPLRRLTRQDIEFCWDKDCANSFKMLKAAITSEQVLAYFDPNKDIEIHTDASQNGLGCVLLQEGRPIAFMSRTLTSAECRYSQLEKEMLAIVFSTEKFHRFIYGYKVAVKTDHKPLVTIFKSSFQKVPGRLQRMRLSCVNYDLEVSYMPGSQQFIADALSRAALRTEESTLPNYLIHQCSTLPMSDEKKNLFKKYTEEDEETATLKQLCTEKSLRNY